MMDSITCDKADVSANRLRIAIGTLVHAATYYNVDDPRRVLAEEELHLEATKLISILSELIR